MDSGKKSPADIIITLYQLSSLNSGCDIRPQQQIQRFASQVRGAVKDVMAAPPPKIPFKMPAPASPKPGPVPLRVVIP